MPDFVKDAFDQAFMQRCADEEKAFKNVMDARGQSLMFSACTMAGIKDMAKIFKVVCALGLEDVMHRYETNLVALGFHEGVNTKID